ncbi:carbohydrate kinase family protein [Marinilabilia salmonicolor]|uniref:carbohydrate kinase family protein n=1 Tax=Marinilabilia salmonicolor TaxID=989 RepID=UPI0002F18B73|nr:carbohydrate kinase [Marinilabilia salmonicolor]
MKSIVCFGEVLWDMLPTGKKLGGAPLNVALRAQSLGNQSTVISAIGNDKNGKEIIDEMKACSANLDYIQTSEKYSTSMVSVHLDDKGSASYEIKMPCAWDDIKLSEKEITLVKNADAFIYGSLIARKKTSRNTLMELLNHSKFNVFDINLRPPHYSMETLLNLMKYAHFIKFNDSEIFEICTGLGHIPDSLEECMKFIAKKTDTSQICVTRGEKGALLLKNDEFVNNKGYQVTVADTVGAGDSFLATLISELLNGSKPQKAIDLASAIGAIVASKSGAIPPVSKEEIRAFVR